MIFLALLKIKDHDLRSHFQFSFPTVIADNSISAFSLVALLLSIFNIVTLLVQNVNVNNNNNNSNDNLNSGNTNSQGGNSIALLGPATLSQNIERLCFIFEMCWHSIEQGKVTEFSVKSAISKGYRNSSLAIFSESLVYWTLTVAFRLLPPYRKE